MVVICCNDKMELVLPKEQAEELCRSLNARAVEFGKSYLYWHTHEVQEGLLTVPLKLNKTWV